MLTVLIVTGGVALLILAALLVIRNAPQVRRQAILADELRAAAQLEAITRVTLDGMRQVTREHQHRDERLDVSRVRATATTRHRPEQPS